MCFTLTLEFPVHSEFLYKNKTFITEKNYINGNKLGVN